MDFSQTKLSKAEWNSIEIPVSEEEKRILKLILNGFENIHSKINDNMSLFSVIKIDYTPEMESFLYQKYFQAHIKEITEKIPSSLHHQQHSTTALLHALNDSKKMKKIDKLRLQHMEESILQKRSIIFEYTIIDLISASVSFATISPMSPINETGRKNMKSIYSLIQLRKSTISHTNKFVWDFVEYFIQFMLNHFQHILMTGIFHHASEVIEKNPLLLKYENKTLYDHQKRLFQIFQNTHQRHIPKCILYTAPTGTGKTISPLGLSVGYRIIYICAARHVALAFAKSAISMEKRVAFAFGCETASDIRLHYFAAVDYQKNTKSGGIYKVDNSNGTKVEIMICDIASYLIAMYYMLSFHRESDIILYFDEPTITLDQETPHPLHEMIHRNWTENKISKVVLSCATLPSEIEIIDVLNDFRARFSTEETQAEIHTITSFDCKKTITILNKEQKPVLPHLYFAQYKDIRQCVEHCRQNPTLLRYFDLHEIVHFVEYCRPFIEELFYVEHYFHHIADITMNNIKLYYLEILEHIPPEHWPTIYEYFHSTPSFTKIHSMDRMTNLHTITGAPITRTVSEASPPNHADPRLVGMLLTTIDAHTITDGPAIYFTEDVEKIATFLIQQSKIPSQVLDGILGKIQSNQSIQTRINELLKMMEDKLGKEKNKDKKMEKEIYSPEVKKIANTIDNLRTELKSIQLDSVYIPNTRQHQQFWLSRMVENAHIPSIDEDTIREIMATEVSTKMKMLLLLGIGVFMIHSDTRYMEIMKRLVFEQRLYIIIASSDFIYGVNYQFCHGILGKDLLRMSQQKIIQSIGRIGRGNIQQEYTIRLRDDAIIDRLLKPIDPEQNTEAKWMNRLFVCSSP